MKSDILDYLDEHGVGYELESQIDRVIGEVDVVYQTQIRNGPGAPARASQYAINSDVLKKMKHDALILHPLPRTVELDRSVDQDPRALYFRQAVNGLYVRMALLTMLLEKD
jgi:aspartate carbamoyltransferase catalytic subunit